MTPSWSEMRQLLAAAAADHPWQDRAPTLLFRGAPTGETRARLGSSMHVWAAGGSAALNLRCQPGASNAEHAAGHTAYKLHYSLLLCMVAWNARLHSVASTACQVVALAVPIVGEVQAGVKAATVALV
jgi:hypothetical protein